jgi:hypothetical protein
MSDRDQFLSAASTHELIACGGRVADEESHGCCCMSNATAKEGDAMRDNVDNGWLVPGTLVAAGNVRPRADGARGSCCSGVDGATAALPSANS